MKREIEKKYRIKNESETLELLKKNKILLSKTKNQKDTIYMREGKTFSDLDKGEPILRIRETESSLTTTLKKYVSGPTDRVEITCSIGEKSSYQDYIKALGFSELVVVKKVRKEAIFLGATITLDNVDNLGDFIEIEIMIEDESSENALINIDKIAEILQLSEDQRILSTYDEMLHKKSREA